MRTVEGSDLIGYRVVDSEAGAMTGRKKTADDALAAAAPEAPDEAKSAPRRRTPAKK